MKSVLAAVAIMACVLMSGRIDLNLEHNMHLPQELSYETRIYTSYKTLPLFAKKVDIYLRNEIKDMGFYTNVSNTLQNLGPNDEVVFHIAGYGGAVNGMHTIRSAIKLTKAKSVTMLVEAPSFSAHAYLALLKGTKLVMVPGTYLMMHYSTVMNTDCSEQKGYDRGISNVQKCMGFVKAELNSEDIVVNDLQYMTDEEKSLIKQGFDVYISAEQIKQRQEA